MSLLSDAMTGFFPIGLVCFSTTCLSAVRTACSASVWTEINQLCRRWKRFREAGRSAMNFLRRAKAMMSRSPTEV